MVKTATVRIVLSFIVIHGWKLHQLDVNNAFLHGKLCKLVYIEQPPRFVDSHFPNHVFWLNKSPYGLKLAPRAWFQHISNFLLHNGFQRMRSTPPYMSSHKMVASYIYLYRLMILSS